MGCDWDSNGGWNPISYRHVSYALPKGEESTVTCGVDAGPVDSSLLSNLSEMVHILQICGFNARGIFGT